MLQFLLSSLFALMCIIMILLILIQKGKSSLGMGGLGGGAQMMFGGGGGQNIFQKATWVLGVLLVVGSVGLAAMKYKNHGSARYAQSMPAKAK